MPKAFEELDYQKTPLGELTLWRRHSLTQKNREVYEVRLDGEFLMSSLVNESEIALARLAIPLLEGRDCRVLVGGLGLGFTAQAALEFSNVKSLTIVELLDAVIGWHRDGLVPLGPILYADPRVTIKQGDFFDILRSDDPGSGASYDAILVDIDHSPEFLLQPGHAGLYQPMGLERIKLRLEDGGIFALWSADPFPEQFVGDLRNLFGTVRVESIEFFNPHIDAVDRHFVSIATR